MRGSRASLLIFNDLADPLIDQLPSADILSPRSDGQKLADKYEPDVG